MIAAQRFTRSLSPYHKYNCLFLPFATFAAEAEYSKPIPEASVRPFFRDVLRGLEYLHFQRVIHRDLKPSNM